MTSRCRSGRNLGGKAYCSGLSSKTWTTPHKIHGTPANLGVLSYNYLGLTYTYATPCYTKCHLKIYTMESDTNYIFTPVLGAVVACNMSGSRIQAILLHEYVGSRVVSGRFDEQKMIVVGRELFVMKLWKFAVYVCIQTHVLVRMAMPAKTPTMSPSHLYPQPTAKSLVRLRRSVIRRLDCPLSGELANTLAKEEDRKPEQAK